MKVVDDDAIAKQRDMLASSTDGAGFGPQSPRDIESVAGTNARKVQILEAFQQHQHTQK